MEKLDQLERTAVNVVRGAGRYGVHLSQVGIEVAGIAEWLEIQIPRVCRGITAVAQAARAELVRITESGER